MLAVGAHVAIVAGQRVRVAAPLQLALAGRHAVTRAAVGAVVAGGARAHHVGRAARAARVRAVVRAAGRAAVVARPARQADAPVAGAHAVDARRGAP
eukprot:3456108-Prymnesium_polylepis.1